MQITIAQFEIEEGKWDSRVHARRLCELRSPVNHVYQQLVASKLPLANEVVVARIFI